MYHVSSHDLEERPTLVVKGQVPVANISEFLSDAYAAVAGQIADQELDYAGPPFARYRPVDPEPVVFGIEAGFPVSGPAHGSGTVELSSLPGGPVAMVTYHGPYDGMRPAYEAIQQWIEARGGRPAGEAWEVYFTDPTEQPDSREWKTEIYQPYE